MGEFISHVGGAGARQAGKVEERGAPPGLRCNANQAALWPEKRRVGGPISQMCAVLMVVADVFRHRPASVDPHGSYTQEFSILRFAAKPNPSRHMRKNMAPGLRSGKEISVRYVVFSLLTKILYSIFIKHR